MVTAAVTDVSLLYYSRLTPPNSTPHPTNPFCGILTNLCVVLLQTEANLGDISGWRDTYCQHPWAFYVTGDTGALLSG